MIPKKYSGMDSIKKMGTILVPFLIYFLVHDLAEIILWGLLEMIASRVDGLTIRLQEYSGSVKGIVSGIAILMATLAIYRIYAPEIKRIVWNRKKSDSRTEKQKLSLSLVLLAGSAAGFAIGMNLLFYQLGLTMHSAKYMETASSQYDLTFLTGLLLYGIISPLAEELLFRGVIYHRMKRVFSMTLSILLTSVIFGAYHGNLVQTLYGTILGILIAISYELFQAFFAPVLFHAVANICVFTLTYRHGFGDLPKELAIFLMVGSLALATLFFYLLWRRMTSII